MYQIFVILSIFLICAGYGAVGGYLASRADIDNIFEVILWSNFWPIIVMIRKRRNKNVR